MGIAPKQSNNNKTKQNQQKTTQTYPKKKSVQAVQQGLIYWNQGVWFPPKSCLPTFCWYVGHIQQCSKLAPGFVLQQLWVLYVVPGIEPVGCVYIRQALPIHCLISLAHAFFSECFRENSFLHFPPSMEKLNNLFSGHILHLQKYLISLNSLSSSFAL